ncbi:hypothetical protein ABZW18_29865 [Streptomyces sp. NPDC004647]|uniref:hypothetical protein n=1 Tax=Streptomyces sp. NPDC004647 TaxID=3154671 RepID=UPI0033BC9501
MPDFPGWDHGLDFVEAYRAAVRTRSRLHKRVSKHPPVVLRTGPDEALQALQALEGCLKRSSAAGGTVPCVPYAHIEWRDGTRTQLIEQIAEALRENTPAETGRLRLPAYDLIHSLSEDRDVPVADQVYARHRGRDTAARPPQVSGSPTITAFFFTVPLESVQSLADRVHRKWWEWRWGLRFSRRRRYRHLWPADFAGKRTYGAALREFVDVRRAGDDGWDGLLLAALMTDLYGHARQGLLHPGRRRRRPRHALLLGGSRNGPDGAVADFITLYSEKQTTCPNPVTVLVAALPDVPGAVTDAHGLNDAAGKLNPAKGEIPAPFEVTLGAPEPGSRTTPVPPVWTPWLRVRPRPELAFEATALIVALWLTGLLAPLPWVGEGPFRDAYTACLTGPDHVPQGRPDTGTPVDQHTKALEMIKEQNRAAEKLHDPGRTVTIALIHSSPPANENELRSGGSIPELRGLALAQKSLHKQAPANDNGILVRIKTYDAGVQYKNAERKAKEVVEEAKKDPQLIGVTGFTESRKETVAALRRLNKAGIPIVSSTATAKEMEVGRYYHGAAPNNRREARVVGAFIKEANTIRTGQDSCAPAENVAVVTDPADVYSNELGKEFAGQFTSTGERIGYTPGAGDGQTVPNETDLDMKFSMSEVAEAVCSRVVENPKTLVYWASRVREFEAFLETFQNVSNCANKDLTVVGGNELTNAALSGGFKEKSWLHLYHTAHMLPASHPDRSGEAQDFNRAYAKEFGADDLWLNDGHAALAHDSIKVLAQAASKASAANVDLTRPIIHQFITNGFFDLEGASGRLHFPAASLQRPVNKMLTVLHHEKEGSAVVLVCGEPGRNIDAGADWRQGDTTYDCPED